jgi:hypothetical protein
VPGAVLVPPGHGGHVGQTPIGGVPFEELRVLGGVVRLPLDGANADVEAGEQTAFGWFENDVYIGLLILAEYLCIQRLRNVTLTPGR